LESAGRDYLVLDAAPAPGSFFSTFPRWRQLISINKVHTGRAEPDFNLRHDWNSLLSEPSHSRSPAGRPLACPPPVVNGSCWASAHSSTDSRAAANHSLLFRAFSSDYYPRADDLVAYLGAWASSAAAHGGGPLRLELNTAVARVSRDPATRRFRLHLADGREVHCAKLVVATGLGEAVPPVGVNTAEALAAGWAHTYATATTNLSAVRSNP